MSKYPLRAPRRHSEKDAEMYNDAYAAKSLTRMHEYRIANGLTTRQLATILHTSSATIARMENGLQSIDVRWLFAIAKALRIPAAMLLVSDATYAAVIAKDGAHDDE